MTHSAETPAPCEGCDAEEQEPEVLDTCDHCEDPITNPNDTSTVITGRQHTTYGRLVTETWCEHCAGNFTVSTEDYEYPVSQAFADSYLYYWESDGEYHDNPEPEDDEDEESLYSYGTDIMDVHGWPYETNRSALAMGVELEMEAKTHRDFAPMLELLDGRDGNGRYILKEDGSLEEGQGAELVTLPYTLAWHRERFGWHALLSDKLRQVARSGRGTTNCGIHIHVNRKALSALTIGKLLVFLNSPDNDAFVTCVAQRESSRMCERDENKAKVTAIRSPDQCRYDILNISGYKTVEFRMFRGNLRPERVLKNLEFCHSLIMFCKESSIAEAEDRGRYLGWLERNAKDYPHLVAFLIEKGRITKPHERSTTAYAILAAQAARVEA